MIQLSDHFTYKRLLRFGASPILMMIFCSIYSVVDGLFVSNFVGKDAFTAVNLVFPFIMVLGAVGFMFGSGGTALVSKTMGEGKSELAKQYFTLVVVVAAVSGAVVAAIGILVLQPVCVWMGASGNVLTLCKSYGTTILCVLPLFMLQNMYQGFFTTAEKPRLGFLFTVASGVTNMVLDALFVVAFKFGILGAAAATAISQATGGILPTIYFLCKNSSKLRFGKLRWYGKMVLKVCTNGSSELLGNISMSLVSMLYNKQLIKLTGDNGVDAFGVMMYVQFIFVAIFIGYCISTSPIVGFNFGAKNTPELQNVFAKSMVLISIASVAMTAFGVGLAYPISALFVGYDAELMEMTVNGMRIYSVCYLFVGFNMFASGFFTSLNNGLVSAIISFGRTLVFQVVCIYVLPLFWGLNGIWVATVVAEALATLLSVLMYLINNKKYNFVKIRMRQSA